MDYAEMLSGDEDFSAWCEILPAAMSGLTRLPFSVVGHRRVALEVLDAVGTHSLAPSEAPLVILFSGTSGCGKTRLAEYIARAAAADPLDETAFIKISCSATTSLTEVFGLGGAYIGSEIGSGLNNFICSRRGRSGVVIIDEFEKLDTKAQLAFLEPWGTGKWVDKRLTSTFTRSRDCRNIIFVLTINTKLPEGDVDDLKAALPFKDEIKGRITHAARFPDFITGEIELLAAAELTRVQRRFHLSVDLPASKLKDFEWRFSALDAVTLRDFVDSAKVKDLVKSQGSRPINQKAHTAITEVVVKALVQTVKEMKKDVAQVTCGKPPILVDLHSPRKADGTPGRLAVKKVTRVVSEEDEKRRTLLEYR